MAGVEWSYTPVILKLCTRWRGVFSCILQLL